MSKHTKGKWVVVNGHDNEPGFAKEVPDCITIRSNNWNVARIWTCIEGGLPEAKANARLIAAAPSLLEACKDVVLAKCLIVPNGAEVPEEHQGEVQAITNLIGRIEDLIEKVEGV